uniref:Uncharacterized protein n=1 Tax=Knipowitschia caucasica TaxID=637954 RepID=A0AAV2JKX1_KNICA
MDDNVTVHELQSSPPRGLPVRLSGVLSDATSSARGAVSGALKIDLPPPFKDRGATTPLSVMAEILPGDPVLAPMHTRDTGSRTLTGKATIPPPPDQGPMLDMSVRIILAVPAQRRGDVGIPAHVQDKV